MTRILAIGEAMVEMAPHDTAGTYQMGIAGDTMNTAWYLRQLLPASDQVGYLTAVGTDTVSDQMVDFLNDAGIATESITRQPDLTVGLYMIQLTDGERSFSYWRGESAARTMANDPVALATALSGADIAYFSGISIAILPKDGRKNLLHALRGFRANGGQVVFDPNLRPRLWASPNEMMETVMQAAAVSDIVLPSHEDEADWFGDVNPAATAERYRKNGSPTVIVKNGSDPMLTLDAGITQTHQPVTVSHVVDTTAAGDSFNAGFLASHMAAETMEKSVQAGARLAAKVIQARGALVNIFEK